MLSSPQKRHNLDEGQVPKSAKFIMSITKGHEVVSFQPTLAKGVGSEEEDWVRGRGKNGPQQSLPSVRPVPPHRVTSPTPLSAKTKLSFVFLPHPFP